MCISEGYLLAEEAVQCIDVLGDAPQRFLSGKPFSKITYQ
jgi:hypothetical protein